MMEVLILSRSPLLLLEAVKSDRVDAISKWLSREATRLGVAKHIYVVGGAVRDFVMGETPRDVDVVIDHVTLGKNSKWFAEELGKVIPVKTRIVTNRYGASLLTITQPWDLDGHEMKGEMIDIANAQTGKDKSAIKSHLLNFDFTFNTLAWKLADLARGRDKAEIIDMTGCGLKDLKSGSLRCPSSPDQTFSEDPSRILRAVKFLVRYGWLKLPESVANSIRRNASKLATVSQSTVASLLTKEILKEKTYKKALIMMKELGLIAVIGGMIRRDKEFRKTMANWTDGKSVQFMFDLVDAGLPLNQKIGFLSTQDQKRFRKNVTAMGGDRPDKYWGLLKKPGSAYKDRTMVPSLAREHGAPFPAIGKQVNQTAIRLMLDQPKLAFNPAVLSQQIRTNVARLYESASESLLDRLCEARTRKPGFVYHVTFAKSMDSINSRGLSPKRGGQSFGWGSYGQTSRGKVFLTAWPGVDTWLSKYGDIADHSSDSAISDGYVPVVYKVKTTGVKLEKDEAGTRDAFGHSAYFTRDEIKPQNLQVWNGGRWVKAGWFGGDDAADFAMSKAEVEEQGDDEWDEPVVWPDHEALMPRKP